MRTYGLYVPLTTDEFDRLRDLARAERRPLRDQAAMLLAQALWVASAGASAPDLTHPAPPPCASPGAAVKEGAPS